MTGRSRAMRRYSPRRTELSKGRHDRSVVARADVALDGTGCRAAGERLAGQHVIESPADVALPHVAPRRPPGEQALVVRIERPADIDQASADHPLEQHAFL